MGVSKDADEDNRPVAKDVQVLDMATTAGMSKEGEVLFYWANAPLESNPLAYPEDGQSLVIFLSDFQVVYKLPGFVSTEMVNQSYEIFATLQFNSASTSLKGFTRDHIIKVLAQFANLFRDTRSFSGYSSLAKKTSATSGADKEVREIALSEKRKFEERAAVPQDLIENDDSDKDDELDDDGNPLLPPEEKNTNQDNYDDGALDQTIVNPISDLVQSKRKVKELPFESLCERATNELLDAIGYVRKIDPWTGKEAENENDIDRDVLDPENTIAIIDAAVSLLTTEDRIVSVCHKDVCRFLRSILPEEFLVIKETNSY